MLFYNLIFNSTTGKGKTYSFIISHKKHNQEKMLSKKPMSYRFFFQNSKKILPVWKDAHLAKIGFLFAYFFFDRPKKK